MFTHVLPIIEGNKTLIIKKIDNIINNNKVVKYRDRGNINRLTISKLYVAFISSTGVFVAIANNTFYGSKLYIMPKIIRIFYRKYIKT